LIRGGLPYLRPLWSDQHWRLYRVEHSTGLVSRAGDFPGPGGSRDRLTAFGPASFTLSTQDSGQFLVRIHYTRYWTVTSGDACVERDGEWTGVTVRNPGTVTVAARFSLGGLFGDGQCSA
jgi:hypothetical protein